MRHAATSKISSIAQLEAGPQTLGFRGEAVHAIMEFGLVDITTSTRDSVHTYRKICKVEGRDCPELGLYESLQSLLSAALLLHPACFQCVIDVL